MIGTLRGFLRLSTKANRSAYGGVIQRAEGSVGEHRDLISVDAEELWQLLPQCRPKAVITTPTSICAGGVRRHTDRRFDALTPYVESAVGSRVPQRKKA